MSISLHQTYALASDAFRLLSALLDNSGHIAIVGLKSGARPVQKFFPPGDFESAVAEAMRLDASGVNAYFCTSTLKDDTSRKAEHVHRMKTFKFDLDIGNAPHKYTSKREAITALGEFCDKTGLPIPVWIDSGNGLHVYWPLSEVIASDEGRRYSGKLKSICTAFGLRADPSVTADLARILRVPGTRNFKNPDQPKLVKLKSKIEVHNTDGMLDLIDSLFAAHCPPLNTTAQKGLIEDAAEIPAHLHGVEVDASTKSLLEGRPKNFEMLLKRSLAETGCNQIRDIFENQASTEYDRWRSGLSIAAFCTDAETGILEISKHHAKYDRAETIAKAADIAAPHTCATFESQRPDICNGCQHRGKITSPIALAIHAEASSTDDSGMPIDDAFAVVREAEARAKDGDVGAPFEPQVVAALQVIKKNDPAEFQRVRAAFKKANRDVSITGLDALVTGETESKDRSAADALVSLARERCTFIHDADGEPHATFLREGHRECWHLRSKGFAEWLAHQFYQSCGIAPAEPSMVTALSTLAGQAKFEGEERPVAVRIAKHGDDYLIDLCNEQWQAVRVTPAGWQVIDAPPVAFIRTSAMRPLPLPIAGGSIDDLWKFANIELEDRMLVLAWLVEAFRPHSPYPILELCGEQGSAKSSTQSILRDLIDPNRANLRAKPKTVDDLFVSAKASHVTSLENLSFLSPDFQDALCALATGSGYGGRQLYTNSEECVFEVKRPVVLNGISVVATRQDLMDRTLLVSLPSIADRRSEVEMQFEFEQAKAGIFGGLLGLFASSLAILPSVKIDPKDLPRMADFAHLGESVFRALGRPDGEFLTKYQEKRRYGIALTIESSPVAATLMAWLDKNPTGYTGPLKQLHESLALFRSDGEQWPRSLHAFGDSLRRISPSLRTIGIVVNYLGHKRDGHHWQVKGGISLPA